MFTLPSSKHSTQPKAEGYIIVVVLLLAAVLLMLALSFAARTTEQVFLSTQEEDTTRVFNAAESGIEQALYDLDTGGEGAIAETTSPGDEATIAVAVSTNDAAQITTRQGETLTVVPINDLQTVLPVMKWKQPDEVPCVGLLITMYRGAEARHASFFSDRGDGSCQSHTLETVITPTAAGDYILQLATSNFGYGDNFRPSDMIRVTPLFNNISFNAVRATQIVSTATDQRATGDSSEVRKIEVIRTQPGPPSVFDYAVFSGGDLVKNN